MSLTLHCVLLKQKLGVAGQRKLYRSHPVCGMPQCSEHYIVHTQLAACHNMVKAVAVAQHQFEVHID